MTVIACLEAVAVIAVVFLFLRHQSRQEQAWTLERRELLTRIQRPEMIPIPAAEPFQFDEREPDEFDLVGTINPQVEDEP